MPGQWMLELRTFGEGQTPERDLEPDANVLHPGRLRRQMGTLFAQRV